MEVISTRRYEVRPPADSHASILVDPANAVATVKEEEWETRKKKEITTTRQIETRVKRQVVLEDGEVVVDSGPLVTTNTTEDVEQQEHTTQERRTTGDEPQKVEWPAAAKAGAVVQKELNETIVKSREEIEELLETEDRQQLGDISDEAYLQAVRNNRGDLRVAIAESKRQLANQQQQQGPRVVQHTTRSNKVVDTEKTLERSELKKDGQIVTERKTTVEHEEIKDDPLPEEIDASHRSRDEVDEARETRKEATQRYSKTRDEDIVDYVQNGERIAREMRFVSETTEAERTGDWPNDDSLPGLRSGSRLNKHEKQNSHIRAKSPPHQYVESTNARETSRVNGHHSPAGPMESNGNNNNSSRNHKESSYSRTYESSRRHQERYSPPIERPKADPPSPPIRRKAREQVSATKTERSYQHESTPPRPASVERTASPVHVVQRTWESRRRDEREESRGRSANGRSSSERVRHERSPERTRSRPRSPDSRSVSPSPARRREKGERSRTSKSPSPTKSKFGESFRKLVGKLRSGSSERGKKRPGGSSTSQLTQTDDSSTYLQYNSVDRNVPLGPDYDETDRPPERPPRSPRGNLVTTTLSVNVPVRESKHATSSSSVQQQTKYRSSGTASPRHQEYRETQQRSEQPIHRYYLGEDPYGGSIYGKEKGYKETTKLHSRHRRAVDEYSNESSTLGRYSKSTSRLQQQQSPSSNDYDRTDHHRHRDYQHNGINSDSQQQRIITSQTLPRKMHQLSSSNSSESRHHKQHHTTSTTTTTKRFTNGHNSPISKLNTYNGVNGVGYHNNNNNNVNEPSRQFGSMVNISFKNPPKTTHYVQTSISTQPPKPERTYKSTLSRSKSFNVEIADDGVVTTPRSNGYSGGYSNNIRSSTHLNRLDETPPLKSPGILASISRSNRDLMRNGRSDY